MVSDLLDIPEDELDIHTYQDEEGNYVARILHRPSSTMKISDAFRVKDAAIDDALKGLKDLIRERRKGLGAN